MIARTSARPFATPTARPCACPGPGAAFLPGEHVHRRPPRRGSAPPRGSAPQSTAAVPPLSYTEVMPALYKKLAFVPMLWAGLVGLGFAAWYDLRYNAGFVTSSQVQVQIDSAGQHYLFIGLGIVIAGRVLSHELGKAYLRFLESE